MKSAERLPGEPVDAYAAFLAWLTAPPPRTGPRPFARARNMHVETVEGWARRYAWDGRRAAYEAELDHALAVQRLDLETMRLRIESYARRSAVAAARIACLALEKTARDADNGVIEVSPKDAAALARASREDLDALAPSSAAAPPTRDLAGLTDEELETLAALEEKAQKKPGGE